MIFTAMRNRIILCALAVIVLLSVAWTSQSPRPVWEYKQIQDFRNANKLGAEGWELVAVESIAGGAATNYIFKRPK